MRQLQKERAQIVLVINEHGSNEGIVTIAELVGEIYDETDRDLSGTRYEPDGTIVIPGRFPIHDLPDVGVEFPYGVDTTIAELILDRLSRLPESGETLDVSGWRMEIRQIDEHSIPEVALTATPRHSEWRTSKDIP